MFIHLTGFKTNGTNFGNMFGEMEVFKYMAGMIAGSRAKTDGNPRIGYMATFPIPEELRLGNAIMLGVKRTCPECTMDVRWINTWHDPVIEKEGAASLFDAGAQVVFTGADTPAAGDVAMEKEKWGVNYDHVGACKVDRCLTAPYWTWGPIYARITEETIAGTHVPGFQYFDSSEGGMGLYGFMEGQTLQPGVADLPAEDVQLVRDTLAAALAGDFNRFDVFKGEILDNQGNVILADGVSLEQLDLDGFAAFGSPCQTCMYWWADGVTAELPDL
jgi:basic membrane protein A